MQRQRCHVHNLVFPVPLRHGTLADHKSQGLGSVSQRLVLHEVELGIVQHDIERYLASKLSLVGESYGLESSWPSEMDVRALARLSK